MISVCGNCRFRVRNGLRRALESTVLPSDVTFCESVKVFLADFHVLIAQLAVILRADEKGLGEADFLCVLSLVALSGEMGSARRTARNGLCFSRWRSFFVVKRCGQRFPRLPVNFLQSLRSNVTGALEKCYSCLGAMLRRLWRKFTECSVKSEMGVLRLP